MNEYPAPVGKLNGEWRPTGMSLVARINAALSTVPHDRTFLVSPDGRLTWGEASERMDAALERFRALGLAPGDRVVIGSGSEVVNCCLFLACLRAGMTAIMADQNATANEIERLVAAARPKVAWLHPEHASLASMDGLAKAPPPLCLSGAKPAWPAPPGDEAIAAIVFTSGTTARPKGVQISHRALSAQMEAFAEVYGFGPDTRLLNLLPLHHVDGLFRGLVAAAVHGAALYRPAPFSIQGLVTLRTVLHEARITHFIAVPAMLSLILRVMEKEGGGFAGPDLRMVISSADTLDPSLWRRAEAFFGVPVTNSWGQSETVCDALYAVPWGGNTANRIGTIGKPVGCEARAADEMGRPVPDGEVGELQIRGPIVMSGYFEQPEETAAGMAGDWRRTGDLVKRDAEGVYWFAGRRSTVIVSKGVSLHPENISAALLGSPDVADAFVVGVPHADWGERIVACVVQADGHTTDASSLMELCRRDLPPEKRPHAILLLPELPRGPSGKVVIDALRRIIAAKEAEPDSNAQAQLPVTEIAALCFGIDAAALSADSTPFNTIDWDSVGHIRFITALETAYGITMTAEDIINLASMADAEAIVARHRG